MGSRDGLRSARLVPDLASFPDVANDAASELFCVSILAMKRETELVFHITKKEVQGIVVRRLQGREGVPDLYERVGFFSTTLREGGTWHHRRLKRAAADRIHVV